MHVGKDSPLGAVSKNPCGINIEINMTGITVFTTVYRQTLWYKSDNYLNDTFSLLSG